MRTKGSKNKPKKVSGFSGASWGHKDGAWLQVTTYQDPELKAISEIIDAFKNLSISQRKRILEFIKDRIFDDGLKGIFKSNETPRL